MCIIAYIPTTVSNAIIRINWQWTVMFVIAQCKKKSHFFNLWWKLFSRSLIHFLVNLSSCSMHFCHLLTIWIGLIFFVCVKNHPEIQYFRGKQYQIKNLDQISGPQPLPKLNAVTSAKPPQKSEICPKSFTLLKYSHSELWLSSIANRELS